MIFLVGFEVILCVNSLVKNLFYKYFRNLGVLEIFLYFFECVKGFLCGYCFLILFVC